MADDRSSNGGAGDEAAIAAKRKAAAYVGQVVGGRYHVEALLALGGMGAVFRAQHVHMRKLVALKLLHPMTENLPELVTRFERESIVGSHVTHPNVCQATDFGRLEDGSHYLVLEYVEGRTLHDALKEGRLAPARAVEIALQMAAGLGAAHELGIVHRDVKPANVMLCDGPEVMVKIVDFGLAKLPPGRFHIDEKLSVTTAGTVFGTVAYMAPELARGMHAVDSRSDLYAVGVILYEMLAGKHPFDAVEPSALFRQHCKQAPPPIADRAPGALAPPALEGVVRKLLEKDPSARYQNAAELIEALDEASPPGSSRSAALSVGIDDPNEASPPSEASPPPAPAAAAPSTAAPAAAPPDARPARPARRGLRLFAVAAVVVGAVAAVRAFAPELRAKLGIDATEGAGPAASTSPHPPVSSPIEPAAPSSRAPSSSAPNPTTSAASASPAPPSASPMSPEALRLRGVMNEGVAAHDAKRGAASLLALAKAAPEAFRDRDLVAETAAVAVTAALDRSIADDVFALLAGPSLGESGPDVLFHMTRFYGGSRGAVRAAELLAQPEVLARASPALRVARELKAVACKDRPALFDRAAAEGDERALTLLTAMLAPECDDGSGACCAPHDAGLTAAVGKLRQRLRR